MTRNATVKDRPKLIACRLLIAYPTCVFVAIGNRLHVFPSMDVLFSSGSPDDPREGSILLRSAA